ncbi:MAG: hypothetical protein ACK4VY_11675 [Brevundimonas sp.]
MTPFQLFYLYFSLVVLALAWIKGGHTERLGVMVIILAYLSTLATPWRIDDFRVGEAAADVIVTLIFAWMALSRERWWPFAATASMVLALMVHLAMVLVPDLDQRADVSARAGLGLLLILSLMAGVAERWLSGEAPVSRLHAWRRRAAAA